MSQTSSPLDSPEVEGRLAQWIGDGKTNTEIVVLLARDYDVVTSEKSIRRFRRRHNLNPGQVEKAYTRVEGDKAEAATKPEQGIPVLDDPDKMLRDRGLSPEDWSIDSITVNEWEGPSTNESKVTYYQAKFTARRKRPETQIVAPVLPSTYRRPVKSSNRDQGSELIVVTGDQQAPFHDLDLHSLFLAWLEENEPEGGILLGDTIDLPDVSRHQLDPENTATVNECLQTGCDLLVDYIEASPATTWQKLLGNHDERLRNLILDKPKNLPLHGLRRPDLFGDPGEEVFSLSHLLRLSELNIELVDPHGGYELGQIVLGGKLAVRHGWIARKGAGASALGTLDHLGYSVLVGHTHRQAIVSQTKHEIGGALRTLMAVEIGCMCRVDQTPAKDGRIWPNYTVAPDWQQGFATVELWPDGSFNIDTAKFVNGVLYWRDQRYA